MIVVSAVTTSSTNITGFLIKVRGSSLTNAEPIAGMTIFESSSADTGTCFRRVELSIAIAPNLIRRERRTGIDRKLLDDRAKRERRKKGQAADNDNHAHQEANEEPARVREGAGGWRYRFLSRQRAGYRHGRDNHPETTDQHGCSAAEVVKRRVGGKPGEGRSVIAVLRHVGVEHLGEAVRPGISHGGGRGRHQP